MTAFDEVIAAMTTDDLVAEFDKINDKIELIALLAPLRLPEGLGEPQKRKITNALIRAAARCWRGAGIGDVAMRAVDKVKP
jgi:hypothetical protein